MVEDDDDDDREHQFSYGERPFPLRMRDPWKADRRRTRGDDGWSRRRRRLSKWEIESGPGESVFHDVEMEPIGVEIEEVEEEQSDGWRFDTRGDDKSGGFRGGFEDNEIRPPLLRGRRGGLWHGLEDEHGYGFDQPPPLFARGPHTPHHDTCPDRFQKPWSRWFDDTRTGSQWPDGPWAGNLHSRNQRPRGPYDANDDFNFHLPSHPFMHRFNEGNISQANQTPSKLKQITFPEPDQKEDSSPNGSLKTKHGVPAEDVNASEDEHGERNDFTDLEFASATDLDSEDSQVSPKQKPERSANLPNPHHPPKFEWPIDTKTFTDDRRKLYREFSRLRREKAAIRREHQALKKTKDELKKAWTKMYSGAFPDGQRFPGYGLEQWPPRGLEKRGNGDQRSGTKYNAKFMVNGTRGVSSSYSWSSDD